MYRVWDDRYIRQSNSGQFLFSGVSGQFLPTGSSGSFYKVTNPDNFIPSGSADIRYIQSGAILFNLTRSLPIVTNEFSEIGSITTNNGAHNLGIYISTYDSNFSVSKYYHITSQFSTPSVWSELISNNESNAWGGNNFALDISGLSNNLQLRLRRTRGTTISNPQITIIPYSRTGSSFRFTPSTYTGLDSSALPVTTFNVAQQTFTQTSGDTQSTGTALQNQLNNFIKSGGTGLTYLIHNQDTNGPLYRLSAALSGGNMGVAVISSGAISNLSKIIIESEVRSAVVTTSSSTSSARVGFTWHLGWWTGTDYFYKNFNHEIGRIVAVGFTGGGQYECTLKTTSSGLLPLSGTTVDIRAQCDNSHVNNEMQVRSLRVYGVV